MAILAAKHELTQQIFTKTMTVQVWKPEHERTGRHFVYTTRYVNFFLRLLYELNDRAGIEALGRQIRKKPGKFFRHARLWHEACSTHLNVRFSFPLTEYPSLSQFASSFAPTPPFQKTCLTRSSKTFPTKFSFKTPTASKHGLSTSQPPPYHPPPHLPSSLLPPCSRSPSSTPCAKPSSSRKLMPTS